MKIHCGFVVVILSSVYLKTSLSRQHNDRSFSSSKRIEGSSSDDEDDKRSSTSDSSHSSDEKSKGDDKGKYSQIFSSVLKLNEFHTKQIEDFLAEAVVNQAKFAINQIINVA